MGVGEGLRNASGATKGGGMKIIDEGVSNKKNEDMKLQVDILIEAEEDPERKALFREYLAKAKKHDAFSFEKNYETYYRSARILLFNNFLAILIMQVYQFCSFILFIHFVPCCSILFKFIHFVAFCCILLHFDHCVPL